MSMITNLLGGMDDETASEIINEMDQDVIEDALTSGVEQELVPHLHEVRQRAVEGDESAAEVRAMYEKLSDEEQTKKFQKAAADVLSVLTTLRQEPLDGLEMLKGRLRDPYTVEALLLIFDHPEVPDDVVQERKNYADVWIRWAGLNIIPEVYSEQEARDVIEQMYPSRDPDAMLAELRPDDLDTAE